MRRLNLSSTNADVSPPIVPAQDFADDWKRAWDSRTPLDNNERLAVCRFLSAVTSGQSIRITDLQAYCEVLPEIFVVKDGLVGLDWERLNKRPPKRIPRSVVCDIVVPNYNRLKPDNWRTVRSVNDKRILLVNRLYKDCQRNVDHLEFVLKAVLAYAKVNRFWSGRVTTGTRPPFVGVFDQLFEENRYLQFFEHARDMNLNPDAIHASGLSATEIDQLEKLADAHNAISAVGRVS